MATGKTSRTFGWILMGLVMVGLVGFGSTNFGGTVSSIGKVGDTDIDANRYARELQGELNAFQAQTGQNLQMAQATAFGLDQQVLSRVIATAAVEDEAARLGVSVGDENLRDRILELPSFIGVDGKFDRDAYSFALDQSGLSAAEFEQSLRAEVSRQIVQAAVANGITTQDSFVDTLYAFARETRAFTWAQIPVSSLTAEVPAPTQAELTAYYEANPADFTLPETKTLTYAWLNPEDLIPQISVEESQITALYDERDAEYNQPERRLVERLVFGTEEQAQAAADAIAAGEKTFEEVVAARDLELADIDLGDQSQADLGAAGDAVFALAEPGVTGPAPSDFGPALFRVNAILEARSTALADVRDELHGELAAAAARRLAGDMVTELDDLMAGGATLEEIAESHDMRLETIEWTAESTAEIAGYESFQDAAVAVTADDFPEITLMADDGAFALRLDAHEAPRLQDQSAVTDAVTAGWEAEKRLELLVVESDEMIAKLKGGESLSSLGFVEVVEDDMTRETFIEGAPEALLANVFSMELDEWAAIPADFGIVLVHLDRIRAAEQTTAEAIALKDNFTTQTAQEIAVDVEAAFSNALQDRAGIVINRDVINAIHAQFP